MPFAASKVANVAEHRDLSSELVPVDLAVANAIPEDRLRICLIGPQLSCDSDGLFVAATHCHAPHPEPSLRDASDLSPQKSGERFKSTAPSSPLPACCRETRLPPAPARRHRDGRAARP